VFAGLARLFSKTFAPTPPEICAATFLAEHVEKNVLRAPFRQKKKPASAALPLQKYDVCMQPEQRNSRWRRSSENG